MVGVYHLAEKKVQLRNLPGSTLIYDVMHDESFGHSRELGGMEGAKA